ncbi:MAG: 5-(carboxyamino)imidazole ribonucleotide mutase [Bacteroidota bacterium]
MKKDKPLIGIVMGSDSDIPLMEKAAEICKEFNVSYEMRIISAHRAPNKLKEFIFEGEKKGIKVFIAGAGLAAHLPGVIASYTHLPVIGVPLTSGSLKGLDSLLSIAQMPSGIPVATVAIDGTKNAALMAIQMLALSNKQLEQKLIGYKKKMEKAVINKDKELMKKK